MIEGLAPRGLNKMKYLLLLALSVILSSCLNWGGSTKAEKVLTSFIDARFEKHLTKDEMLKYISGEMAAEVNAMPDEEFVFFSNRSTEAEANNS